MVPKDLLHRKEGLFMANKPFKVVKPICGGLDIHKNKIQATVQITDLQSSEVSQYTKVFGTLNNELAEMCKWLIHNGCRDVAMESTGKYWIPVANILEDYLISFKLVHPKYVKAVAAHKTDKIDASFIASLNACDMCGPGSVVFPKLQRFIRYLGRRYWKLGNLITAEKNRYQNCMTTANIGIGSVFSDPFGKSAQAVMDELLNNEVVSDERILKLIHKNCKNKDKILDAVHGSKMTDDDKFLINDISCHINELHDHRDSVIAAIVRHLNEKIDVVIRLTQIKGIQIVSALLIICEIGLDMSFWDNARQFTSWCGVTPRNNESAGKKKSTRITSAGLYLKPLLVQCALAAVKDKNGYFGIKYRRIRKRRGHKKAIIAICRMMLICIYHMIRDDSDFCPSDYEELMNPKPKKPKAYTIEGAIKLLSENGYSVTSPPVSTHDQRNVTKPPAAA